MTPTHILSIGSDSSLMSSRSLILRSAGYFVHEAYTIAKAINLVEMDSIDAVLICHTIPKDDQRVLISVVRQKRRLMPVLCIRSNTCETVPRTCTAVDNQSELLLHTVKLATTHRYGFGGPNDQ